MAKLAIGIPCYNEEQHIAGTLLSAIQQLEYCSDLEILVSDNKSSDCTVSKVEDILDSVTIARDRVTLVRQDENIGANQNFWQVYDDTDSEFFMWLGGHDQISGGYAQRGLAHMSEFSNTALFSGQHRALNADGAVTDLPISYDFLQENPIERYLQSIVQLSNCYIFHSIFRRKDFLNFQRISAPGADHILISHLLWSGVLHQSDNCFYSRRYFSEANRE
ncbi:MAG: glycosyltransferase, partial [Luminiphilus sp.]|nr:glycosyltransferase [Luminiphilus sp.]